MGSKRTRRYRQHSAADKVAILRQVLLNGEAVSAVCEEHDVSPALFYTWQKQFFENGAAAFAKDTSAEQRALERTVGELRQRLVQKDRVIAKVTEEFVKTKKEPLFTRICSCRVFMRLVGDGWRWRVGPSGARTRDRGSLGPGAASRGCCR